MSWMNVLGIIMLSIVGVGISISLFYFFIHYAVTKYGIKEGLIFVGITMLSAGLLIGGLILVTS